MTAVSVIGLGTMGQGIAVAAAAAGHVVAVFDQPERLEGCVRALSDRFARYTANGELKITAYGVLGDAVRGAEIVIEAVPEDLGVKHELFKDLNAHLDPAAVLATNTSSLPLDQLAGPVAAPERFLAAHFFNPAELIPGVEVAATPRTAQESIDRLTTFLHSCGKEPILVAPRAGFVANRLQLALFLEALACVEDGTATAEEVDAVIRRTVGFRLPAYGPFTIADMAGLDVYHAILGVLQTEYGPRFAVPERLQELIDAGRLGVKAGAGFREYSRSDAADLVGRRDALYRRLAEALA
ncbi:3-hydroxyacyl-CoA dehydrogenase family protein [Kribbella solani]|uniref:3-hydroxybutyryl-CoA dehydrogenase n=1 Tax=Kribbella solani TaxID=236067 RepID=A0A841E8X3_9ACTN|nr:3-hydroxyacyl-CoA dehydrogenase family protein [Kribbella solani]MBB5983698.1 3-hydroxybutyryl-CoA dehydrogenase [Kribbella solani]